MLTEGNILVHGDQINMHVAIRLAMHALKFIPIYILGEFNFNV